MGKIKRGAHYVDVELEAKDFFNFNTPLLPMLTKFAWVMLKNKAPALTEGMQASRLLLIDNKLVARFYRYRMEAEVEQQGRMDVTRELVHAENG